MSKELLDALAAMIEFDEVFEATRTVHQQEVDVQLLLEALKG